MTESGFVMEKNIKNHKNGGANMMIKAVKFRKDGFYSQPFVFGGEEGMDRFDPKVRYRGSLQNYLIDTGDEVILVDTGLPAGTPEKAFCTQGKISPATWKHLPPSVISRNR